MTFTAQELTHRITFEEPTMVVDPMTGYETEAWLQVGAESFAKIEPLVGREFLAAAAMQAEGLVKFTIRHRSDITTTMRLMSDGEAWNMTSIQNIKGRNLETLIYAQRLG